MALAMHQHAWATSRVGCCVMPTDGCTQCTACCPSRGWSLVGVRRPSVEPNGLTSVAPRQCFKHTSSPIPGGRGGSGERARRRGAMRRVLLACALLSCHCSVGARQVRHAGPLPSRFAHAKPDESSCPGPGLRGQAQPRVPRLEDGGQAVLPGLRAHAHAAARARVRPGKSRVQMLARARATRAAAATARTAPPRAHTARPASPAAASPLPSQQGSAQRGLHAD